MTTSRPWLGISPPLWLKESDAPHRYDNGGTANASTSGTTGNITDSTLITGSGSSATTTDISYAGNYPAYGAAQPHAPAGYTTTNGNAVATSQTWTAPGQLSSTATGGTTTSYNWNGTGAVPGQLASVIAGSTTTSYRYDASGSLLVRKDGSTSRLYLPGEELSASGSTVSATRYYSLGGKVIAARTSSTALSWLFADPHGTATTEVNPAAAVSSQLTWRWHTPFGQFRPPVTGSWPGTRRFGRRHLRLHHQPDEPGRPRVQPRHPRLHLPRPGPQPPGPRRPEPLRLRRQQPRHQLRPQRTHALVRRPLLHPAATSAAAARSQPCSACV